MVLTGMWSRGWTSVSPKYSLPAINIVSLVFSLADCTLGKHLSTQENWIYNLGQNKMEQQTPIPPPPPKSRMKPREGQKRAIFPSLIWEGGLGFPFILSKIVGLVSAGSNGIEP